MVLNVYIQLNIVEVEWFSWIFFPFGCVDFFCPFSTILVFSQTK